VLRSPFRGSALFAIESVVSSGVHCCCCLIVSSTLCHFICRPFLLLSYRVVPSSPTRPSSVVCRPSSVVRHLPSVACCPFCCSPSTHPPLLQNHLTNHNSAVVRRPSPVVHPTTPFFKPIWLTTTEPCPTCLIMALTLNCCRQTGGLDGAANHELCHTPLNELQANWAGALARCPVRRSTT
jgi:hypothetical protein